MTLGEKIFRLRSENGLSQEAFGESLGVSRQSVSKWETDQSLPELEKIVAISELFGVSTDYLLKEKIQQAESACSAGAPCNADNRGQEQTGPSSYNMARLHYEYRSRKTVKGVPLVHVNIGMGMYLAKGIFAVGNRALGVVSFGFFSVGVVSAGLLTTGLLSLGTISLGLISLGTIAVGLIAVGAINVGLFCMGAVNYGQFCVGALSYGKQVAIGDEAHGRIALGFTRAAGEIFEEVRKDAQFDYPTIEKVINENVPSHWGPFRAWIKGILRMMTGN